MGYPTLICPDCGFPAKCMGYHFAPGIPRLNETRGLHHVYHYECSKGHKFNHDFQSSARKVKE